MKTFLRLFLSLILLISATDLAAAETRWINNITVSEYNITWGYTETFTGMDSIGYKISIDTGLGNNDSFVNAWELLKADKEARNKFKNSIEKELDIKINNQTYGIEMIDVDSSLSQSIIGKTHVPDTIENRFNVTYRLKGSIFNASSVWFLGEPKSPVSIILPAGIDVIDISGMDNMTKNIDSHTEVIGFFSKLSAERGEITINIAKNASYPVNYSESNITEVNTSEKNENITKPVSEISQKIKEWSIIGIGIIFIVLIYVFKVRKN
jgi:hypothetical protein